MDKPIHEENFSRPLQTNKKSKLAVTILTSYNRISNTTTKDNKLKFTGPIDDVDFSEIALPTGPFEMESSNEEKKPSFIEQDFFRRKLHFLIQTKCST